MTLQAIEFNRNAIRHEISTEDFGFKSSLKYFLPSLFSGFKETTSTTLNAEEIVKFNREQKKFLDLLKDLNYFDMGNLTVFVPEGMSADYVKYLATLINAVEYCQEKMFENLKTYNMFLAVLINNKNERMSMKNENAAYIAIEQRRKEHADQMDACFTLGEHASERRYKDTIKRNADWNGIITTAVRLSDMINAIDRNQLKKQIDSISEMMNVIKKEAEAEEFSNISSQMLSAIADGAYQCAKEVEFYSVVHYRALGITHAIESTIKKLTDNLGG